ncbi:MAG: hypothetical protein ABSB77_10115, partial [Xanthobacteraceae bacterium]
VACEFNVRRWEPSHLYTKTAPVARRIFDHQCKTTFATQSANSRHLRQSNSLPAASSIRNEKSAMLLARYEILRVFCLV